MRYQFGQGRYGVPPGGPDAPAGPGVAYRRERGGRCASLCYA